MRNERPIKPLGQDSTRPGLSPIIRIGEDRGRLSRKLAEYKVRLAKEKIGPYDSPEKRDWDTIYKIAVAQKLIDTGEVNTYALSNDLASQYGGYLNVKNFENACAVIQDYISTGGKSNEGGTGFPKTEEN